MSPWDDVEVDTDGDELLDWLWDFPERYDVGGDEYPSAPVATSVIGVRKHLRRTGETGEVAAPSVLAPAAPPVPYDDRPTLAMDPVDSYQNEDEESGYPGFIDYRDGSRRFPVRDMAAVAAVILVVALSAAVGYTLFHGSRKSAKPANLAIASPTTTNLAPSFVPPVDTTPASVDTTTSIPPTTVPSASSVPGAVVGVTSSTTRHTATTTVKTTTTTTTVPATTTTAPTTTTTTTTTTSSSTTMSTTSSTTNTSMLIPSLP